MKLKHIFCLFSLWVIFFSPLTIFANMPSGATSEIQKIKIKFCSSCGFRRKAIRVASEIERATGVYPKLVISSGGLFKITAGDKLIFSRKNEGGRFPKKGEITQRLQSFY